LAPENTLSGFCLAWQLGVDAVELDVHLTADGEIIVHHEYCLNSETTRTPSYQWLNCSTPPPIKDLTLAKLKVYDVGRLKPGTTYAHLYPMQEPVDGECIPTLHEVIATSKTIRNGNSQFWIEIKTSPEKPGMTLSPETVADVLLDLLGREKISDRTCILSFDWRCLLYIQKVAPGIPAVYLTSLNEAFNTITPKQIGACGWTAGIDVADYNGSIPRTIRAAGGRFWAPGYQDLTSGLVEEAHALGIKVFAWTPDDRANMLRLINMNVDGIITNRPDILKSLLN
jgi:glycerophosphoryl diester phosphodiesterase